MKRKQRNIGNRIQLVVDEMLHLLGNSSNSSADVARGRSLQMTKLEERVLMSAAPMAVVAQVATVAVESSPITETANTGEFDLVATEMGEFNIVDANIVVAADANNENRTVASPAVRGIELIVIDSRVQDADTLLESLLNTDRDFRLLRLDASSDGLTQISEKLEQLGNVSAIHLLTHGNSGEILLGSTVLNGDTLAQHAPELVAWQHNLTANADILLYGCDVAATTEGKDFVESLHKLTGVDIAASVDATGHEVFGGNWDLEYTTGVIETSGVFTQNVQQNWLGKLASINVTTFADTVDGNTTSVANLLANKGSDNAISLREAILAINAGAGGDTINLAAGTYTLSRAGANENLASTGDLDVLRNVTIIGTGAGTTTINGNGIDRIFEIRSGTLNLSGVTIQGGNASVSSSDGGGLLVGSGSFATVTNTVFTGNSAKSGGAIANDGTLTLTSVSIQGNNSTQFGGGIASVGTSATLVGVTVSNNTTTGSRGGGIYTIGGTFSATNVTISGNSAVINGGGINATSTVALQNVTITNNSSSNGSGVFADPASSISLRNSIVAGNNGSADIGGSVAFISQGNNLIGNKGTATGFTDGVNADQVGTGATPINPLLGSLQNNGGSTLTHALLAGSTAIDAGTTTGAPTADQRGISRVGQVDIGAYEYVPTLTPTGQLAVNVTTGQTQETSGQTRGSTKAVSITPSGNYVVVWTSNQSTGLDANGRGILMRVFRPDGTPLTGEIQVNQTTNSEQQWATVATDDAGNGVVVWTSTGQDSGSTTGVYARRFNAAGALVGNEFLVNTTVAGNQENAAVAMTGAGAFVVTWSGTGVGDAAGVFYRRFAANGTPLDITERLANGTDRGTELAPSIAINDAGQFAIAWHVGNDLYTRNFAADGTAVTADIQVDNGLANAYGSAVGIDALGRTVVVYRTDGLLATGSGVWARAFNADGTEWHTWIAVASGTGTDQTSPSIAMDDAGNFIVTYESSGDGSGNAVYVRRYNSDFSAAGTTQQVNVTTAGNQQMASVAMLDLNYYVVVWSGQGPGDNDGVFARQFSVNGVPPVITSNGGGATAAKSVAENTTAVTTVTATDADMPSQILTYSISGGADAAKFTINSSTGVLTFITAPDFETPTDFGADNVYDVVVQASDGVLFNSQAIAVTVTNQAVTVLTTTGNATVNAGSVYTLNLSANEDVTSWTINWGDGSVETFVGNSASATHTYSSGGFTFNILASATDASGTVFQNQLLVPTYTGGDSVFRFAPTTGGFLQEFATSNGLNDAIQAIIGPDGKLYVTGEASNNVLRYNATTGAFIDQFVTAGSGGLSDAGGLAFGPDGNLYVANYSGKNVLRYNANTGAFMNVFLSTGTASPYSLTFGPDGKLYVSMYSTNEVRRYDATTGAFINTFVSAGSGGLNKPEQMIFGPDGNLYVASLNTDQVLRYNGTTGAFMNAFVSAASGGLDGPSGLAFGPDGNLYVTGLYSNNVLRYNGTTGAFLGSYVTAGSGGLATPAMMTFLPEQQVKVLAPVNNPPTITSNGGEATASINVAENTTSVTTVTATDADLPAQPLGYSIIGGADSAKFAINSSTGVLSFITAPDFESPTDAGSDNIYDVTIQVSDGTLTDTQAISVTVTNVNDIPPVVTVGQSFSVSELATTGTTLGTVAATDGDGPTTYSNWQITAGNGGGVFAINASTGLLTIASAANLNFDITPSYILSVTVSDGVNTSTAQTVSITVLDSPNTAPVATNDSYTVLEGGTLNQTVVSNWFNSNWKFRQQLVFNNSASSTNLINTAVLVKLHASATDAIQIDYSATQNAGQDLRFVDTDGTVLAYEIEQWDESGYSYVWVKVPQIDGGSTTDSISMYYGNATAIAGQNPQAVWSGTTAAVFHLNTNANDSTSNANNGLMTNVGGTSGKFASSGTFDGATSSINVGSATSVDNIFVGGGAISAWINPVGWGEGGYGRIVDKGNSTAGAQGWGFQVAGTNASDGYLVFESDFTTSVGRWRTAAGTISQNGWQNVAVVYDNSSATNVPKIYVNGIQLSLTVMSTPVGTARSDAAQDLTLGNRSGATDRTFSGRIDEVRISSASLSTDQIKADYKSAAGTFITAGSVETGPGGLLNNDFDVNGDLLTVTLVSGPAHAASFTLNPNGSFTYVHDGSETATDSFIYRVSDGSLTNTATVYLTITPVNDNNPIITSNGGGATAAINVAENATAVTTVTATDADLPAQSITFSITGGSDALRFQINSTTGVLSFKVAPDFEVPTDLNLDNVYEVQVTANDNAGRTTIQSISVTVLDISGPLIVDTTLDLLNGDVSSVEALIANKGVDGKISLREAILATNNTPGTDIIQLSAGNYVLTRTGINEDAGLTGDLDITGSLTIRGAGSGITTIDANGIDRVLDIKAGITVNIEDVTIRGGSIGNKWGGGINVATGSTVALTRVVVTANSGDSGGGVYNYKSTIVMTDTTIDGNSGKWGGGFYNDGGTATLNRVTVSNNTASTEGGGIYNVTTGGSLIMTNVTVSGNTTPGAGGGLYTKCPATITNSTIAYNSGSTGGGIYISNPGTATLKNTIVAFNTGGNANQAITSLGNNIDSGATLGLSQSGDRSNTDPLLATLQNNGGFTKTHALLAGSAAINTGALSGAPALDQRGISRDATPDIGAFELIGANGSPWITSAASVSVAENQLTVTTVTASDPENDPRTFAITSGADEGLFTINSSTGELQFKVAPNYEVPSDAGADNVYNVTIAASDGNGGIGSQAVTITVTDVNEPPSMIINQTVNSLPENTSTTSAITIATINIIDDALGTNTLALTGADAARFQVIGNSLRLKAGTVLDFEIQTSYTVNVELRDATLSAAPFSTQTVNLTITNIDEPPTANAGGPYSIAEGNSLTVLAGPSVDPEGLPLTYAWDIDGNGTFDEATGSSATLTWSQLKALAVPINDNGTRTIRLRVTDQGGNSAIASTTLTITNTAPTIIVTGNATATSGTSYTIALAASDPGADTIASYSVNWGDGVTQTIVGTATSASHTYLNPGGTRSIAVTATDEDGIFPMTGGPIVVTVNNTPPSALILSNTRVASFQNGATVGTLSFTDPDVGDTHTWTVSDNRFRVDGSTLRLKPGQQLNPLTEPTVTLTVMVTDASGAAASSSFTLQVNNAPVSAGDAYAVDGTQQLSISSPSVGVLANDTDPDGDTFSASLVSGPTHAATFGLNANGTFWYRATTGYSGVDTFSYVATDGVNVGAVTTITFTVNQPATLSYTGLISSIPEHQTLTSPLRVGTVNVTDDGIGTNTITLAGPDAALFELDANNNLSLKSGLAIDYAVQTQFHVTILLDDPAIAGSPDSSRTLIITVQDLNEAPTASALANVTVLEDAAPGTINTASSFHDPNGDALSYSVQVIAQSPGLIKTISINQSTGVISYSLNANANGTATIRVTAKDPSLATVSSAFQLTVQPVNDAPVAQNYSATVNVDKSLAVSAPGIAASITDVDGNPLTVILVTGPTNGAIVLQANGSFVYTPDRGFQGIDTFRYIASDGVLVSNVGTATISVIPEFIGQSTGTSGNSNGFGSQTTTTSSTSTSTASNSQTSSTATTVNSGTANSTPTTTAAASSNIALTLSTAAFEISAASDETTDNSDDVIYGILPSNGPDGVVRFGSEVVISDANESSRSTGNDLARRTSGVTERYDYDRVFSQSGSNEEMAQLNAQRESLYRQLSERVVEQSESVAEQLENSTQFKGRVVGSVGVVTTGFSVGYLFWAIRGGMLVSGLLAQIPAWTMLDPLLVIDGDQKDEDKESLQNLMDRQQAKMNRNAQTADNTVTSDGTV